jgi:hypothetical protein
MVEWFGMLSSNGTPTNSKNTLKISSTAKKSLLALSQADPWESKELTSSFFQGRSSPASR